MVSKDISVFLVAANRLLRETLAKVLSSKGGINVCGVSPSIPDALGAISASGVEILVLDSFIPGPTDGGNVTEFMPKSLGIKIVLIDMDETREVFLDCVKAGAMGYLLKDASAAEVLSAIRAVSHGQAVFPPQVCVPLLERITLQPAAPPAAPLRHDLGLTRREQQLVPLIARGLTNKEIASQLNVSEQTIKNHVHNMLRRVGANSRLQVIDVTNRRQTQM